MLDRLSLLDTWFLERETPSTPMHLGGLGLFAPGLAFADVAEVLRRRLHRIPLARKRLQAIGYGTGQLAWVDDSEFDLSYHLRHAALPAPGGADQLAEFLSQLVARPLDRDRPLWEAYVVEGLEGGRSGLFRKTHLAMTGAESGDPLGELLDDRPVAPDDTGEPVRWQPAPAPSPITLAREALRSRVERVEGVGRNLADWVSRPSSALGVATQAAGSVLGVAARLAGSRPASPLNLPLSPQRRVAMTTAELDDLRVVRRAFGGTINDVVVAVTADAVGRLLRWRGHETKDLDLKVMVPVRVAAAGEPQPAGGGLGTARTLGHGVVGVLAPLPVMRMDPVARLYRIMGEMAGLKESRQAVAAASLVRLAGYGPANLHARAARVLSAERRYNVALSNAPGPQAPRYLGRAQLERSFAFIPLAGDSALSIAVSSYVGGVYFGLLGDRRALPDLELLGDFVTEALDELVARAEAVT